MRCHSAQLAARNPSGQLATSQKHLRQWRSRRAASCPHQKYMQKLLTMVSLQAIMYMMYSLALLEHGMTSACMQCHPTTGILVQPGGQHTAVGSWLQGIQSAEGL
jgi:hypothetical protein